MNSKQPFKWKHFEGEIILLCVRWYLKYALSYRNLEEIMQERGLSVDHTTRVHPTFAISRKTYEAFQNYCR
jgi:IS6 family transposase